jgi:hypothetical protein
LIDYAPILFNVNKNINQERQIPQYKSAAVAVYSAPEKLNEANKRLEEKLVMENLFES